jgi:hypothetical protein
LRERAFEDGPIMDQERIVAIGLLTETHLRMLGSSLKKVLPITDDGRFTDLLKALDDMHSAKPLH